MGLIIVFIICIINGILWHMGGSGHYWARPVVCALISIVKMLTLVFISKIGWVSIFALAYGGVLYGMLSLFSYGVTSPIHKFWVGLWNEGEGGDSEKVEICVRGTCSFMWSLSSVIFAILTNNWVGVFIYIVGFTVVGTIFGRAKKVAISETGIGATIGTSLLI